MSANSSLFRLASAIVAASLLQGCVVAVVPLAAGGLIGGKELGLVKKGRQTETPAQDSQLASASSPGESGAAAAAPASQAAGTPPASPSSASGEDTHLAMPTPPAAAASPAASSAVDGHALPGDDLLMQAASTAKADEALAAYQSFHAFTRQKMDEEADGKAQHSMVLLDPGQMSTALTPCGKKQPAVLLSLDPKDGPMSLAASGQAQPGLASQLADLRDHGAAIYWISRNGSDARGAIRQILADTGLDPQGKDTLILKQSAGDRLQSERNILAESHCLLAIAGSKRDDFDDLYDYLRDPSYARPLEKLIGHGWFLAPPPVR